MIYRIAFASSDGVRIDKHFGAAEKFFIADLDTKKEDYELIENRDAIPPCNDGDHEISKFDAVIKTLRDVDAIVAQRIGPGAEQFIKDHGIAAYQIPLEIEQALCLLLEEKQWEVDKWRSHTKN
jgi:predicted Fe-Mo cluster-binding NifX family protein